VRAFEKEKKEKEKGKKRKEKRKEGREEKGLFAPGVPPISIQRARRGGNEARGRRSVVSVVLGAHTGQCTMDG